MKLLTISQVSQSYDVTPRMLRHYEKLGLIQPLHQEDYAYRMYDENAVRRLQQIILFRKLRIPLKQIAEILRNEDHFQAFQIMQNRLAELDEEISALCKVRLILQEFVKRLGGAIEKDICFELFGDEELTEAVRVLTLSKTNLKEEYSMDELNLANEKLDRRETVRIVMLPSCTVASYHYIGENPEEKAGDVMNEFVQKSRLYEIKPDARMFGFNHPNPGVLKDGTHGYEDWVTIPEDMDVPEPLTKKRFEGGMYAALTIPFPEFHRWADLTKWIENDNERFEANYSEFGGEIMGGCLEEHLNWIYSAHMGWPENGVDGLLDLLLPIKLKEK